MQLHLFSSKIRLPSTLFAPPRRLLLQTNNLDPKVVDGEAADRPQQRRKFN